MSDGEESQFIQLISAESRKKESWREDPMEKYTQPYPQREDKHHSPDLRKTGQVQQYVKTDYDAKKQYAFCRSANQMRRIQRECQELKERNGQLQKKLCAMICYQEEAEYLAKVNLLQTTEIQKLRLMLKQFQPKDHAVRTSLRSLSLQSQKQILTLNSKEQEKHNISVANIYKHGKIKSNVGTKIKHKNAYYKQKARKKHQESILKTQY